MRFRSKPVEIEAVQWLDTDESWAAVVELVGRSEEVVFRNPDGALAIGATSRVRRGNWIVKGVLGELFPCGAASFTGLYEAVQ